MNFSSQGSEIHRALLFSSVGQRLEAEKCGGGSEASSLRAPWVYERGLAHARLEKAES